MVDQTSTPESDPFVGALQELSAAMHARGEKFDTVLKEVRCVVRTLQRVGVAVLVCVLVLVGLAVTNRKLLGIVNDTVNPDGHRFQESQKRTAGLIINLSIEDDCRFRRAIVDPPLPAPDPHQPCAVQTSPDVYPGKS